MPKIFASSKAKAALARSQYSSGLAHSHSDLTALNTIRNTNGFIYTTVGLGVSVSTKTTTSAIAGTDTVVLGDATSGNIELTLPNPTLCYDATYGVSMILSISKVDSSVNYVRISPYGTETIAGDVNFDLLSQNECINLITNGTNWYLYS